MNRDDRDNHEDGVRYVLTEEGMRFLAARAGVPPSSFGEHGAVTYLKEEEQGQPERAVRHLEHTLGLNRFMVELARDARACGWVLAEWRNEAESTCRFVDESGRPAWIRPDASGLIGIGDERVPFLVEYDRGTLDAGDYAGKFAGYRRYYASEAWRTATVTQEPSLLFVCSDDRAERRVMAAIHGAVLAIPVLATAEWRFARDPATSLGVLGPIWQTAGGGGRQAFVPLPVERGGAGRLQDVNNLEHGRPRPREVGRASAESARRLEEQH